MTSSTDICKKEALKYGQWCWRYLLYCPVHTHMDIFPWLSNIRYAPHNNALYSSCTLTWQLRYKPSWHSVHVCSTPTCLLLLFFTLYKGLTPFSNNPLMTPMSVSFRSSICLTNGPICSLANLAAASFIICSSSESWVTAGTTPSSEYSGCGTVDNVLIFCVCRMAW